jgi:hypothetical protein
VIIFLLLLIPPLEGPLIPTSGFGEYRPLRFHTGIDLSTDGVEGKPLLAVGEGTLYRIKVSYTGFGKALYLKLKDGRIAVYAHLSRFTPSIDSLVYFEQLKRRKYRIDLVDPPSIPFKEGDIIGFSGQSGAGPPHLHFEIRTPSNRPLNPFFFLPLEDTLPPVLESVTFIPRKKGSLVDGFPLEKTYKFTQEDGVYTIEEIPNIYGNFGINLKAYDRCIGNSRLSLYRVSLFLDGDLMFSLQMDSIDFKRNSLAEIYHIPKGKYGSREVRLFHLDKVWLPQVITSASSYKVSPGLHEVLIEATDCMGNTSTASFIIKCEKTSREFKEPNWHFVFEKGNEVLALFSTELGLLIKATKGLELLLNGRTLPTLYKNEANYYFVDEPGFLSVQGSIEKNILGVLMEREGGCVRYGSIILEVEENSLPEPTLFWITDMPQDDYSSSLDNPVVILPENPPTLKRFIISVEGSGYPEKSGIFRREEKLVFIGKERGLTRTLGTFVLSLDTIPPFLESYGWKNNVFMGILKDDKSGVDEESINFYLDGKWVPVDYDIETGILKFKPIETLSKGIHTFSLTVRDRMGNILEKKIKIGVK